ncbi:MAG: long-chain-acyl-CoA synthetase [Bauldia sp.]
MGVVANLMKDVAFARHVGRTILRASRVARNRTRTFPDVADDLARRFGDRVALISDRETFTYAEYNARANRYARWARANGIGKGDVVCLLMPNRPEYLAIWLGIARVGGVTALLNTNLTGQVLAYSINIVAPKHIIVAAELEGAFATARSSLTGAFTVWGHGACTADWPRIDQAVMGFDDAKIPASERPALTLDDRCLYIYTSGTTGSPKAANINHFRVLAGMNAFSTIMGATAKDRMYDCLPLYHTTGGVLAVGSTLMVGGSVFIREKFSARQFWDDVVDHDCTLFQYIGELCRYLLNAPPHPKESQHRIRLCCGNGLRPDIWVAFQKRFKIPVIREFYAATEGNCVIFNADGTPGAVGRVPSWAQGIFPIKVVRFDIVHEQVIRGDHGLCIECPPDEVGEVISKILVDPMRPGQRFDGYADKAATEKKILPDAFVRGDRWFRTGDLMRRDEHGNFFFVDRIGDTFRWKGENVSTSEVAEMIDTMPEVAEATVYGVPITGTEGKAGMAAIVPGQGFDLAGLRLHIDAHLTAYARPMFIRVKKEIDATSTFKQRKVELARDGFDPRKTSDPIYFKNLETGEFVLLDEVLFQKIQSGAMRL